MQAAWTQWERFRSDPVSCVLCAVVSSEAHPPLCLKCFEVETQQALGKSIAENH